MTPEHWLVLTCRGVEEPGRGLKGAGQRTQGDAGGGPAVAVVTLGITKRFV